jgi:transcriptional regulator with XRE-family HTH domain
VGRKERLREEYEKHFRSLTEFQGEMKGSPGSSYASVHSYIKGTAEPNVDFLRKAADVFGVRPEWLILGEGERTIEEELARKIAPPDQDLDAYLRENFPYYPGLRPDAQQALGRTIMRLASDLDWRYPGKDAAVIIALTEERVTIIGEFIRGMVRSLYNPTTGPRMERLEDFVIAVSVGVRAVIPLPSERGGETLPEAAQK